MTKAKNQQATWPVGAWKPRRSGAIFCSPACGHGCTWEDHQVAKERAKALAELLGPGWKPHVWENFGWHYSINNGVAQMHGYHPTIGKPYYTLFINSAVQTIVPVATSKGLSVAHDPVALLRAGLKKMKLLIRQLQHDLDAIGGPP